MEIRSFIFWKYDFKCYLLSNISENFNNRSQFNFNANKQIKCSFPIQFAMSKLNSTSTEKTISNGRGSLD